VLRKFVKEDCKESVGCIENYNMVGRGILMKIGQRRSIRGDGDDESMEDVATLLEKMRK
jgi:hypothetical protein